MQSKNTMDGKMLPGSAESLPAQAGTGAKPVTRTRVTGTVRKSRVRKTLTDRAKRHDALTSYEQFQLERYGNYLPDGEPPLEQPYE